MADIKVSHSVVYPCCSMFSVMLMDNNPKFREELIKAGWTLKNKNLIDVMKNNKTTVPDYVHRQCFTNCFLPTQGAGGSSPITLKDNDVIAAPIIKC